MGFVMDRPHDGERMRGWFCRFIILLAGQDPQAPLHVLRRSLSALAARIRILWAAGRPVLFLAGLCVLVSVVFLAVSLVLSAAFFLAGTGALALGLRMSQPVSATLTE